MNSTFGVQLIILSESIKLDEVRELTADEDPMWISDQDFEPDRDGYVNMFKVTEIYLN